MVLEVQPLAHQLLAMLELLVIQVLLRQVFLKHFLAVLAVLAVMEGRLVIQEIVGVLALRAHQGRVVLNLVQEDRAALLVTP